MLPITVTQSTLILNSSAVEISISRCSVVSIPKARRRGWPNTSDSLTTHLSSRLKSWGNIHIRFFMSALLTMDRCLQPAQKMAMFW